MQSEGVGISSSCQTYTISPYKVNANAGSIDLRDGSLPQPPDSSR